LLVGLAGCNGNGEGPDDDDTSAEGGCPWDEDDSADTAGVVTPGTELEGYLCPTGDQDWYALEVPAGDDLVSVQLIIDAPLAPVEPTYTVWDGAVSEAVGSPQTGEAAVPNMPLQVVHGLSAGSYYVVVRDQSNDAQDTRHAYELLVTTSADADTHERNDSLEDATEVTGDEVTGYISYRGDEDWFRIESPALGLLDLRLTMDVGGIEPAYRVVTADEELLVADANEAGTTQATDLSVLQALGDGGTYYVVVSDDDGLDVDGNTPYTLSLAAQTDPDENEVNDHPDDATGLTGQNCGANWSAYSVEQGYLASAGDTDWYRIDVGGCVGGLIEAEMFFHSPATLPEDMEASLRVVREVSEDLCDTDQDCQVLSRTCESNLDCSRRGNLCLASNFCAGAGVCMPSGLCGAVLLSEDAAEDSPDAVTLSAPVFGLSPLYLAVSDYHADAYALDNEYTVRVRVRTDPDTLEQSERYTAGPPEASNAAYHTPFATELPVYDCAAGFCCDENTWTSGALSYSYDQDWFRYEHPCPEEDCMVRVVYRLDGGAVDFYMRVFEGNNSWFDNIADIVDLSNHPQTDGYFGGLDPADYCFYAWQGHTGSPYYYYISVRDTIYVSAGHEEDGDWDHDPDQAYQLCIEKVADGCVDPPCFLYEEGCGVPN